MNAKKCDRCGIYYEEGQYIPKNCFELLSNAINELFGYKPDYVYVAKVRKSGSIIAERQFDLCPECNLKLRKFMDGEEPEPAPKPVEEDQEEEDEDNEDDM